MSETPTLYEWAGGRELIERMIGCFYDRVERDDLLSPLFPGGVSAAHREHVTTWWCEVFDGPAGYNSQPGAEVVERAPVPHWGWGVAPPYQP
jgi:hemoglobin